MSREEENRFFLWGNLVSGPTRTVDTENIIEYNRILYFPPLGLHTYTRFLFLVVVL